MYPYPGTHTPKKLIWIYGVEEPELFKTLEEIWTSRQCEVVEGFPEDLMSRLEKTNDRGSLCIFDDVMNEVSSNATISKLFTRGRSHLGCSLVLMLQNIFPKGSQSRTISIKADFLSWQKLLATIFFSKEISQVIIAAMVLAPNFY